MPHSQKTDVATAGVSELTSLREENARLKGAVDELDALLKISKGMAEASDFTELMQALINQCVEALNVQYGVITLAATDDGGGKTLVRAQMSTTGRAPFGLTDLLLGWVLKNRTPLVLNDPASDPLFESVTRAQEIRNLLCTPLTVRRRLVGMIVLINKLERKPFDGTDERFLAIVAAQSAPRLESSRLREEREGILSIFGRHLSPAVVDLLVEKRGDIPPGRQEVCTMFLDLRGYTAFSEDRHPEEVVAYLNDLFRIMLPTIEEYQGLIHQLLGDGFMAVFGSPISTDNDSQHAFDAALEILRRVESAEQAGDIPPTRLSIGLHTGFVIAGIVGATNHQEYKVTGDAVNVAARIEQLTREFDTQFLFSESVLERIDKQSADVREVGSIKLRGRNNPVRVFSAW